MRTSEAAGRSGGRRREEEFNIHFDGFARFLFFFFLGDAPRARRAGATYRTSSTMVRKRAVDRERRTTE
jgi:hypothetical protein